MARKQVGIIQKASAIGPLPEISMTFSSVPIPSCLYFPVSWSLQNGVAVPKYGFGMPCSDKMPRAVHRNVSH
jgi:hypothetical protein